MARIISFGKYEQKMGFFDSVSFQIRTIWAQIASLDLFTKLTILIVILFIIAIFSASGQILQRFTSASENVQVGKVLPPNCHIAADFSKCTNTKSCTPESIITCDK